MVANRKEAEVALEPKPVSVRGFLSPGTSRRSVSHGLPLHSFLHRTSDITLISNISLTGRPGRPQHTNWFSVPVSHGNCPFGSAMSLRAHASATSPPAHASPTTSRAHASPQPYRAPDLSTVSLECYLLMLQATHAHPTQTQLLSPLTRHRPSTALNPDQLLRLPESQRHSTVCRSPRPR